MTELTPTRFRLLRQFDEEACLHALRHKPRARPKHAVLFPGDDLAAQFARALCEESAGPLKEILEAFEFFQATRRFVAAPHMVDLCSGHGLVGTLFALFQRKVLTVTLLDRQKPGSYERILTAADRVGPWTRPKLTFLETSLDSVPELIKKGTIRKGSGWIAVHACGLLTDRAIEMAIETEGHIALLPCCHPHKIHPALEVLKFQLGGDIAIDVHRTYRLENSGYRVRWKTIPEAITPKNRILIGSKRSEVS